jgi:hypothetical protein
MRSHPISLTPDPGLGCFPPPGELLEAVVGMHSSVWDKRTTALIVPTTQELEEDAKAMCDKMFGKPLHMVGYVLTTLRTDVQATVPRARVEGRH